MSNTAFDGFQETSDLAVAGWHLDADELVVFLELAVGHAVDAVVDEVGNALGETVADITELAVVTVDFVRVVAVYTVAGVHLEVVGGPALGSVYGA